MIFNEELRHFSSDCAKDCDEAFKSTLIEDDSVGGSWTDGEKKGRESSPYSLTIESPTVTTPATDTSSPSWQTRPLPPLPPVDASKNCLVTTSYGVDSQQILSDEHDDDADTLTEEETRLAVPVLLSRQGDRRATSAPVYSQPARKLSTLPSIHENSGVHPAEATDGGRVVSAPPHGHPTKANERNRSVEYLSKVENTIRVVHSPGAASPVKVPKPLNVRKKKALAEDFGRKLHRQLAYNAEEYDDHAAEPSSQDLNGPTKKKISWFKRSSKAEPESNVAKPQGSSTSAVPKQAERPGLDPAADAARKSVFSFPFWKSNRARDSKVTVEGKSADEAPNTTNLLKHKLMRGPGPDYARESRQVAEKTHDEKRQPGLQDTGSGSIRNIEVKQTWLTRLFRVKPATSYICMALSRKRARQEVAILLREWRRYGIKGIQVDKQRNIVFARLAAKNCK